MRARPARPPRRKPAPGRTRRPETSEAATPLEPEETGPLRRCLLTRESGERARMIRFVLAPDRRILPDLAARLPGRGMWLSARRDVIEAARAQGRLTRALTHAAKGPVVVPPDLAAMVEAGLIRRVVEFVGLARRAGQAVAGFAKARDWLVSGRAALILQAYDGSPEERRRLLSGMHGMTVAEPLDAVTLGSVFGRDHAVHVAVAPGRLAQSLQDDIFRLSGVTGRAMTKQVGE